MELLDQIFAAVPDGQDATGDRILTAALDEFLQVGIRRARLEEIARRAGVSRVTIHRRFAGKQDLLTAVLVREARRVVSQARTLVEAEESIPDKVATGFLFALDYARHGKLSPLLSNDPMQILPSYTIHGEPIVALLRTFFIQTLHDADTTVSEAAADVLARTVMSYCLSDSTAVDLHDPAATADFARTHLARIIQAPA